PHITYLRLCFYRASYSFPTRRSSDLAAPGPQPVAAVPVRRHPRHPPGQGFPQRPGGAADAALEPELRRDPFRRLPVRDDRPVLRSEEHTSELQSRENLVCRLLLEKKK